MMIVVFSSFILIFLQLRAVDSYDRGSRIDLYTTCIENTAGRKHVLPRKCCLAKTDEFVLAYGYNVESHKVHTDDGYILTVFRVNQKNATLPNRKIVVVHHGLLSSSDDIAIPPPGEGLAYSLADNGYDVWIPNARGNYYSKSHKAFSPLFTHYWKYSWDDIGLHDYPAIYAYIRRITGVEKYFFIGHSRGVTAFFALLCQKPEFNDYFYAAGLLAPPIYFQHAKQLQQLIDNHQITYTLLQQKKDTEILPRSVARSCSHVQLCKYVHKMLVGKPKRKNEKTLPLYTCHFPSGAATNELLHYADLIKYGYFGPKMRGHRPKSYSLDKITVPMSIHYSAIDQFTPTPDVERMIRELVNVQDKEVNFIPEVEEFEHADFLMAVDANRMVYTKLLNFFEKYVEENNL